MFVARNPQQPQSELGLSFASLVKILFRVSISGVLQLSHPGPRSVGTFLRVSSFFTSPAGKLAISIFTSKAGKSAGGSQSSSNVEKASHSCACSSGWLVHHVTILQLGYS